MNAISRRLAERIAAGRQAVSRARRFQRLVATQRKRFDHARWDAEEIAKERELWAKAIAAAAPDYAPRLRWIARAAGIIA